MASSNPKRYAGQTHKSVEHLVNNDITSNASDTLDGSLKHSVSANLMNTYDPPVAPLR